MNAKRLRSHAATLLSLVAVAAVSLLPARSAAAQGEYDKTRLEAVSASRVNGLALPPGGLRIIDAETHKELAAQLANIAALGGNTLGRTESLVWGGKTHSRAAGQSVQNALRQTLKKNGYGYEVTREEKTGDSGRMTFFVAAKPGGKESLLGFFFADDKVLMLTWGETTPKGANVPSAKPDAAKAPSAAEQKKLDDALDVAVEEGTADEVKALIAKGARANRRTNDGKGQTLVQRAVVRRSQEKLALLLQAGADPNAGSDDMLPLTTAALTGQSDILELLLDKGANVNAANPETGRTALHQAAIVGNTDIVQRLLRRGADPARADKSGQTPRQIAEAMKQTAVAELLSEAEAKKD
jgi:hypothetical protein